jgi:hypothetical protein
MTNNIRDARTFVALQFELAANEADMMEPSADMKRRMAALGASIRRREAQRRYAENALWPVKVVSGDIRSEILAMSRAEVIAELNSLRAQHPGLQYMHRDCETQTDHDLRSALEDALTLLDAGK